MGVFSINLAPGGFGGLDNADPARSAVDAAVLPVPYDATVTYRGGARYGPQAIIGASAQVELYDAEWGVDLERLSIALLDPVEPGDAEPEDVIAKIETACEALLPVTGFLLTLGGEHSVTIAPVRALSKKFGGRLSVVQFDAHADLRDTWQGSPWSHACVMRRVAGFAPIVQIGLRNISKEEKSFIDASGHPVFPVWELDREGAWIEQMVDGLEENVYITFDLDGLDPAAVPGVGTPEPDGLSWRQATDAIKAIGEKKNIVGADVVELAPIAGSVQSEFAAAKLCFKLLAAALLLK